MFTLASDYSEKLANLSNSIVQPKFDGIRCRIGSFRDAADKTDVRLGRHVRTRTCTRSGGYVPNDYARSILDTYPEGLDGELLVRAKDTGCGEAAFSESMSAIRAKSGEPDFVFMVYDYSPGNGTDLLPYAERMAIATVLVRNLFDSYPNGCHPNLSFSSGVYCSDQESLDLEMARLVELGHEGAIVRNTSLPFQPTRSSKKYPAVLRIKAWAQVEAEIVRVVPETWHDCETNRRLRPELVGTNKDFASSFECKGLPGTNFAGQIFRAPLSVPDNVAKQYLTEELSLVGKLCTVRYLAAGCVNKPRLPVCIGVRHDFDVAA